MERYLVLDENLHSFPVTHALVIGVGAYPHLIGGSDRLSPHHDGMGQLTSPPVSARSFAEWLISQHNNPGKPLSTVALLLSEADPKPFTNPKSGEMIRPGLANYDNVAQAIRDWKARGQENPDNLLLFYFCGHGMAKAIDMTLLMSDYGNVMDAPLENALDFRKFRLGMSRNLPRQQVYFVDACRASSETLIEAFDNAGRIPVHPGPEPSAEAPVFYATLAGEQAFGRNNNISVFTSALLTGLKGSGSDDSEGDWRVTTTRLKEAIDFHMRQMFAAGLRRAQVPPTDELTTFDLHYLKDKPEVGVMVTCEPEAKNSDAWFHCIGSGLDLRRVPPEATSWSLTLPAGDYQFQAEFQGGAPIRIEKRAWVRPVYRKVPLEVR